VSGYGQKSLFVCYHLCNIEPLVEVVKIYRVKADSKPDFHVLWAPMKLKKKGFAQHL
jgi:hypothetical protein